VAREASKTRKLWTAETAALLHGRGIDIGCGDDPVASDAMRFDRQEGDAQDIGRYLSQRFDYVFASHVLEHMRDPQSALANWFALLKPGGHLFVLVPDEDLYELGHIPSLFNDDHKWTFTIHKNRSWSPVSQNVLGLARSLPGEIVSLELQDLGYDRRLARHTPGRWGLRLFTLYRRLSKRIESATTRRRIGLILNALGMPIDQTTFPDDRMAQIQLIVRKPERANGVDQPAGPERERSNSASALAAAAAGGSSK
jgi:SAM-dependent methyltransferase